MKKMLSLFLAFLLVFAPAGNVAAATDLENHYAKSHMELWISMGYISGYPDGSVRPDNPISRAEFYSVVNRSFGYYQMAPINFSDVKQGDWYYQDIAKAAAAGYITLDPEAKPDQSITREEVAVIIVHVANMTPYDPGADIFSDVAGSWRKPYIGAVAAAGIMRGYGDGTFRPYATITRAETVVALSAALNRTRGVDLAYVPPVESTVSPLPNSTAPSSNTSPYVNTSTAPLESSFTNYAKTVTSSSYGSSRDDEDVSGNMLINTNSTSIRNVDISGDLVLSSSVKGSVTLSNVYVGGNIYIYGAPRLTLENSSATELVVSGVRNDTRVTLRNSSDVATARLYSGATLSETNTNNMYSGFSDVVVEEEANNAKVSLSGRYENVDIFASRVGFSLTSGSINTLTIDPAAERGTYNINSSATVSYADVGGRSSSFTGTGRIIIADVRERSVTFSRKPETVFGDYGSGSGWNSGGWSYGDGAYRLSIYVTDRYDDPVDGARVSVYKNSSRSALYTGTTDYYGTMELWLDNGTYEIVVRSGSSSEVSRTVRINGNDMDTTVKLGSGSSSSGYVNVNVYVYEYTSNDVVGVRDATVTLHDDTGRTITSATTSSSGYVTFYDLSEGDYTVYVYKAGYPNYYDNFVITSNSREITISFPIN